MTSTGPLPRDRLSEMETPRDSIKCKIATIGTACPIEIGKPVAMADVAEPRGLAGTRAGGPVVAGMRFTAVADRTGASGPRRSETGEPVVTGIRFQIGNDMTEASGPAVTGAGGSVGVGKGFRPISGIAGAGGPAGTGAGGQRRGRHRGGRRDYGWHGGVSSTLVPHGMDE